MGNKDEIISLISRIKNLDDNSKNYLKERLIGNIDTFLEKTNKEEEEYEWDFDDDEEEINEEEEKENVIEETRKKLEEQQKEQEKKEMQGWVETPKYDGPRMTNDSLDAPTTNVRQVESYKSLCKEIDSNDINKFLNGYEQLAYLGKSYSNEKIDKLFLLAKEINILKGFNLFLDDTDRLEKVLSIDNVAHNLHKQKYPDGSSQYKILDDLADISKSFGEEENERIGRLVILSNPQKIDKIHNLFNLEILQKGLELEHSNNFWRLYEKAIQKGLEKLTDKELVLLREWLYAKI